MVATAKKYRIMDPATGALDRRIFIDQAIYDEEMDKIFGRAWLMIGHESLVPDKNDFFHTYMGEDPVIITRDGKGVLHAFLNMCRHRGNRVVRADDGNAKNFLCTYHGWTFGSDGRLEYVPGEAEVYFNELRKEELGLVEARLETYAGIIFANWDKEAPSLEAYLGDARWYLDAAFNRRDSGMVAYGPEKWIEPCNWKTPVDNCSDNYHLPISHYSSAIVRSKYLGVPMASHKTLFAEPNPNHHVAVGGHSLTFRVVDDDEPRRQHGITKHNFDTLVEHHQRTMPEVERRLGAYRAHHIHLGNHSLFPNTVLGFRLALPRGPLKTEFWHFALVEKDMAKELHESLMQGSSQGNGAAGLNEQDDIDNWRQVTESSKSPIARRVPHVVTMGAGRSGTHPTWPGDISSRYISEHNQRHFYKRWEEFMNAESWADIPTDPITAKFEGSATMTA